MDLKYDTNNGKVNMGTQGDYNNYNSFGLKADIPEGESGGVRELQKMQAGKAFRGEVTDIMNSKVTIRLDNGQSLQAAMQEPMIFHIGDQVIFQIKSNEASLIEIKPLINAMTEQNPVILKAVEAANIPVNDKVLTMMQKLLNEQMPIDRKSLQGVYKQILSNPDASIDTIVQMNKLKIPVTRANIGQYESYKNYEHRIAAEIEKLAVWLPEILDETSGADLPAALKMHKQLLQLFVSPDETDSSAPDILQQEHDVLSKSSTYEPFMKEKQSIGRNPSVPGQIAYELQDSQREDLLIQLKDLPLSEQVVQQIRSGSMSVNDFLKELEQIIEPGSTLLELFHGNEYKKLLKAKIIDQWLVKPEDLMKEKEMQAFYERLKLQCTEVENIMAQYGKADSAAAKSLDGLKDNIEFMNQINQLFTYIQLPLKMSGQNVHSDLYIFTNKKRLQEKKGSLSALLHLDMDVMGSMDIYVELNHRDVHLAFEIEEAATVSLIEGHISELSERIQERGYHVTAEVTHTCKKIDFVQDFLEREHSSKTMQRYSFDVRA